MHKRTCGIAIVLTALLGASLRSEQAFRIVSTGKSTIWGATSTSIKQ